MGVRYATHKLASRTTVRMRQIGRLLLRPLRFLSNTDESDRCFSSKGASDALRNNPVSSRGFRTTLSAL